MMTSTGAQSAENLMRNAQFRISVPQPAQLPDDNGIEVAFAGRSNSGKSSTINVLCQQRNLARTSRTPGRTQHLVVFDLDPDRRLIDLPGFGYAKVSKTMRAHWEKTLPNYLEQRRSLRGMMLLMDVRHPLKPVETTLIEWCSRTDIALHVLLNKSDKVSRGEGARALELVHRELARYGDTASAQLFSAEKRHGRDQALAVLGAWFELTHDPSRIQEKG